MMYNLHVVVGTFCETAGAFAFELAVGEQCSCPRLPSCNSACGVGSLDSAVVVCDSGCYYCDSTQTVCGSYSFNVVQTETVPFVILGILYPAVPITVYSYSWTYTKGRTGHLVYLFNFYDNTCEVEVDGQNCTSCKARKCTSDGTIFSSIDCTNLEAGAVSTSAPCGGNSTLGGGLVALDESALDGVLAPLAIPFWGCRQGTWGLQTNDGGDTAAPVAGGASTPSGPPSAQRSSSQSTMRASQSQLAMVWLISLLVAFSFGCGVPLTY
jgi:hypothetical protein